MSDITVKITVWQPEYREVMVEWGKHQFLVHRFSEAQNAMLIAPGLVTVEPANALTFVQALETAMVVQKFMDPKYGYSESRSLIESIDGFVKRDPRKE